jgi:hypothetical protein
VVFVAQIQSDFLVEKDGSEFVCRRKGPALSVAGFVVLEYGGFNEFSLFPDLEGLSRHLKEKYRIEWDRTVHETPGGRKAEFAAIGKLLPC